MTAWRRAQAEFLADIAVEPTVAYRYEQLGLVYSQQQEDQKAEAAPLQAVRIDPRLTDSHVGLAQIYDRQQKYAAALAEINAAGKLDPASYTIHYVRAQILLHMGRTLEAKSEMQTYTRRFADACEKGRQALDKARCLIQNSPTKRLERARNRAHNARISEAYRAWMPPRITTTEAAGNS